MATLSNEDLAKLMAMAKANQAMRDRTYDPFSGRSMSDYRQSVGWENPELPSPVEGQPGTVMYRGKPYRAYTNRPDSSLVGAKTVGAQSPTKEAIKKKESAQAGEASRSGFVVDDPFTFDPYVEAEKKVASEKEAFFQHVFQNAGNVSERNLTPEQKKHWDTRFDKLRKRRLDEAKRAQDVALRRKQAKGPSAAERKYANENAIANLMGKYGIREGLNGGLDAPEMTKEQAQALKDEARAMGLNAYFDETTVEDPGSKLNPLDNKDVQVFKVRAIAPGGGGSGSGAEQTLKPERTATPQVARYDSPESVRDAYRAGNITREQARAEIQKLSAGKTPAPQQAGMVPRVQPAAKPSVAQDQKAYSGRSGRYEDLIAGTPESEKQKAMDEVKRLGSAALAKLDAIGRELGIAERWAVQFLIGGPLKTMMESQAEAAKGLTG